MEDTTNLEKQLTTNAIPGMYIFVPGNDFIFIIDLQRMNNHDCG